MWIKRYLLLFFLGTSFQIGSLQEARNFLYEGDDCKAVQAFQLGRNYYYTYDATAIHTDSATGQDKYGLRAKCSQVMISVLSSCVGRLKVDECTMYDGEAQNDSTLSFETISSESPKLNHLLHRYPAYFYFNSGEITKVFLHEKELDDIANMKKAILSSISLKFTGQGFKQNMDNTFKISSTSIFGVGDSYASIAMRSGNDLNITTRRYLFEHRLPWTQFENSIMRMSNLENSDFYRFIAHEAHTFLYTKIGASAPTQTCQYYVTRGRRVADVTCNELHTVPLFSGLVGSQHYRDANNYVSTDVTLHLELYRISTLKSRERMRDDQKILVQTSYKNHTLMFQSSLNKPEVIPSTFDPQAAFLELLEGPKAKTSPVFAKLTMWIQNQDETTINALWRSVISSLASNPERIPAAMNVWIQLLSECMDQKWCQANGDCSHLIGCQIAFSSVLSSSGIENMEESVQFYLLDVMSSIKNPASALLQTALHVASLNPNPASVLALGKTLNRHASLRTSEQSNDIILEAKEFLHDIISRKCSIASQSIENENTAMYAIKSLGPLIEYDNETLRSIINCMEENSIPSSVLTAAVQAMNHETIATLPKVRRQLSKLISDRKLSDAPRIASFLVILNNVPNNEEISTILNIATDSGEERGIKYFINEYIKSQLLLGGTEYGLFSKRTIERILTAMNEAGMNTEQYQGSSQAYKKTFEFRRTLSLPVIKQPINGTIKMSLYFSGRNPAPFMIDVSLETEIHEVNISLLDIRIDVRRVTSVLMPLLGEKGFLPLDVLEHLMNIPLHELLEPSAPYIPHTPKRNLNKLKKIADQFKLAQTLIDTQKKSIVEIKLFGKEVSSYYFNKFSFFRDNTLSKLEKLMDTLSEGISFNTTFFSMPGFFKSEVPTSIGLPLTTSVELTQFNHHAFSLMIEVKKLYFTQHGTCRIQAGQAFRINAAVERVMKLPYGKPCGSGVLFTAGRDVDVQVEGTYSPKGLTSKTSTRPKNQLFLLSSESLAPSWTTPTGFEITSQLQPCRKSMINEYYDVALYTTKCGGPIAPSEAGLWLESSGAPLVKDYLWGPMKAFQNGWDGVPVPSVGFNMKVYRSTEGTTPAVFDFNAKYLPLQKEIQIFSLRSNRPLYMIRSNFMTTRDDTENIENVFVSFNISTAFPILTSTLFVQKASGDTTLENKLSSLNLLHLFHYGSELGYDLKANLNLPANNMQFNMLGHIPAPTPQGEITGLAKIFVGSSIAQSLCTIVYEKTNVPMNNHTATKVDVVLKELRTQFFPYENASMSMTWFNKTSSGYGKILRMESWFSDEVSGPFIDLRQATAFASRDNPSRYNWNATITTQKFQGQWTTEATDLSKFTINSHLVIPDNPITVAAVRPTAFHLMKIPVDGPGIKVYGIDVALGSVPEGRANTTLFYTANQYKSYIQVTRNLANCDHCFALEVYSLAMKGCFEFAIRPNVLKNVVFLKMLPSLARNFNVPTYLLSTYDDGQLKLGYNVDVNIASTNVTLSADSRAGSYVCKMMGNLNWEAEDPTRLLQTYASGITLSCEKEVASSGSISDLVLETGLNYVVDKSGLNRTRKIDYNHFIQKSEVLEFNETYSWTVEVDNQLFKQFSSLRNTEYSLAELETYGAVTGKKGSFSALFTHQQETAEDSWYHPNYHLNLTGILPSLLLTPGEGEMRYDHTGFYFLGPQPGNEEGFEETCESLTGCEERRRNMFQSTIDRSMHSLLRVLNFSFNEYQYFVDAPWEQLQRMQSLSSNTEQSPFYLDVSWIKDAGAVMVALLKRRLADDDRNIQTVLSEGFMTEDSLLQMQRYLEMLATMEQKEEYNLTSAKLHIESLFRMIYQLDYALSSILENPLVIPTYANFLNRKLSLLFSPIAWAKYLTKPYTIFGVLYPDVSQLITMNNHYYRLPSINNEDCKWLSLVDVNSNLGTALFNHSGLFVEKNFLGGYWIQSRHNTLSVSVNNSIVPREFPFFDDLFVCTKLINNEMQCNSPFASERDIYDPINDEVTAFVELRGLFATSFEGFFGVAGNETTLPKLMLPDGSIAINEADLMNKYELSGEASCQYNTEDFTPSTPHTRSVELCEEAFERFQSDLFLPYWDDVYSLKKACADKARTAQDTCKYTTLLVHSMQKNGLQVFSDPVCLNCGATEPITVTTDHANLLLIISRSKQMKELNPSPEILLPQLVRNTLQLLQQDGIAHPTVTLLTYGGALHFYQPMINTIGGAVASSDLDTIIKVISILEFDGPSYDSSLTGTALRFVAETMRNSPQGVIKTAIIIAPESAHENIGVQIPPSLAQSFNNDLTSVFMLSNLSEEDCVGYQVTLPLQTAGACYLTNAIPSLGQAISRVVQEKIDHQVSCTCKEDGYTGLVDSQCSFV